MIGRTRTAQISTGSTTTRLLGTFQQVQHVFLIGCAGGVAHLTDPKKHVRRGDIIVGYPNDEDYVYGETTTEIRSPFDTCPLLQEFTRPNNRPKVTNSSPLVTNRRVFNFTS